MTQNQKATHSESVFKKIDWTPFLFLTLTPITAIVLTAIYLKTEGLSLPIAGLFVVMYFLTSFSITAGYHRFFAHKAYEAHPLLQWFYALFGAASFQNSILLWAADHRVHHRHVDQDGDPYNIRRGFFYAHIGWMLLKSDYRKSTEPYGRDLRQNPIVMFQHNHYVPVALLMGFGLPTLIGAAFGSPLGGLAVGGFLRLTLVHHMTFFINSLCHTLGRQPYTDTNSAKDSWLMALFTNGEGYHNFHHYFANDYRNGIRWYHWDPTKWPLGLFAWMGLAWDLKTTPEEKILEARMQMDERRLRSQLAQRFDAFAERLESLKQKIQATQTHLGELRRESARLRKEMPEKGRERLELIRSELKAARRELRSQLAQWRMQIAILSRQGNPHPHLSHP